MTNENKTLQQILDSNTIVSKMKSILSYIMYDKCKQGVIRVKDYRIFGLEDRSNLLSCFMEEYYQYRFEDENGVDPNTELYKKRFENEHAVNRKLVMELSIIKNRTLLERVINKDI